MTRDDRLRWPATQHLETTRTFVPAPYVGMLVEAIGLGLHHRGGWTYYGVDLALPAAGVAAVVGPPGSGRSSLLLTLSGRMRHTEGELRVAGLELPRRGRRVRRQASVARIGGAVDLEGRLTVRETLIERGSLDGVRARHADAVFDEACDLLDLHADQYLLVERLPAADRARLALAAALVPSPVLVVLDDLDAGLHIHQQRDLWQRLRTVAATGIAVVASTADPTPAYGLTDVDLQLPRGATSWEDTVRLGGPRRGARVMGGPR